MLRFGHLPAAVIAALVLGACFLDPTGPSPRHVGATYELESINGLLLPYILFEGGGLGCGTAAPDHDGGSKEIRIDGASVAFISETRLRATWDLSERCTLPEAPPGEWIHAPRDETYAYSLKKSAIRVYYPDQDPGVHDSELAMYGSLIDDALNVRVGYVYGLYIRR